jgi:hypothetical protein
MFPDRGRKIFARSGLVGACFAAFSRKPFETGPFSAYVEPALKDWILK